MVTMHWWGSVQGTEIDLSLLRQSVRPHVEVAGSFIQRGS